MVWSLQAPEDEPAAAALTGAPARAEHAQQRAQLWEGEREERGSDASSASEWTDVETDEEGEEGGEGGPSGLPRQRNEGRGSAVSVGARSSIASSYWRPERHDRRGDLSIIDERWVWR